MFQKLHVQLTFFCSFITICILCLFTVLYLRISEKTLTENHVLTFRLKFETLCANLEQQTVLNNHQLLKLEQTGNYIIYLWDNNVPLFFNSLEHHQPYNDIAERMLSQAPLTSFSSQLENGIVYDIGITKLNIGQLSAIENLLAKREQAGLTLIVMSPRTDFLKQLHRQRMIFLALAVTGSVLLTIFAWIFTGRLLRTIKENQEKQIQFIADASHELRTPLAVVRSCISVCPPNFEKTIQEECIHMSKLIENMLTLTNLETHKNSIEKVSIEPDTFLLNLYEHLEPLIAEQGLSFQIQLPDTVLPTILGDPNKINQLFMILIHNAISYTKSPGTITLSVYSLPKKVCFQVIDTGLGVADKDKERIFQRFYRKDGSHSSKEHFGLGLCIAREIMTAHHGDITVSDTNGGGSTFTCCFPLSS